MFYHFERFLADYERCFEKEYGFFRPIVKEVVERYLNCANPRSGVARIRCPNCQAEHLLMFSCKTRGFCPSCHAKRLEEWGEISDLTRQKVDTPAVTVPAVRSVTYS